MMWKPSVNAIWLRAAPRSEARGRALVSEANTPSSLHCLNSRRRPLDARELSLHRLISAVADARGHPVDQQLEPLALAPEVEQVHTQVHGLGQSTRQLEAPDLAD